MTFNQLGGFSLLQRLDFDHIQAPGVNSTQTKEMIAPVPEGVIYLIQPILVQTTGFVGGGAANVTLNHFQIQTKNLNSPNTYTPIQNITMGIQSPGGPTYAYPYLRNAYYGSELTAGSPAVGTGKWDTSVRAPTQHLVEFNGSLWIVLYPGNKLVTEVSSSSNGVEHCYIGYLKLKYEAA